jgi:hypothetical protein
MHQINEYREEEHLPDVGFSTVHRTTDRLRPVIRRVKRRKQGNMNPDSPWAKARLRWVTQLLVRLGEHVFDHKAKEKNEYLNRTEMPTYFNTELLPPLIVHQIVFFDECHNKTDIGRTGDTVYTFPKNEAGLYDKHGWIGNVDTKLHCKYKKEGPFCVVVSAVELNDGTIEGRRCETFNYSAKILITITAEEKMIAEEINRVRGLKSDGQWVEKRIRLPGQLYENDSVMAMGNITEKTATKLKRYGIITVLDMKMLTQTESSAILKDTEFRVSDGQIKEWHEAAQQANEGSVPSRIRKDHRKDETPYLS